MNARNLVLFTLLAIQAGCSTLPTPLLPLNQPEPPQPPAVQNRMVQASSVVIPPRQQWLHLGEEFDNPLWLRVPVHVYWSTNISGPYRELGVITGTNLTNRSLLLPPYAGPVFFTWMQGDTNDPRSTVSFWTHGESERRAVATPMP